MGIFLGVAKILTIILGMSDIPVLFFGGGGGKQWLLGPKMRVPPPLGQPQCWYSHVTAQVSNHIFYLLATISVLCCGC